MSEWMIRLLPCVYAFIACIGFSIMFNIHSLGIFICAFGGGLGWLVYLLCGPALHSPVLQSLMAGIAVSLYSEIMARVRKCPVTAYLIVSLFPLVPGGGIYYTMEHALKGETELFYAKGMETLGIAGALAVGVLLVASVVRLFFAFRHHRLHR